MAVPYAVAHGFALPRTAPSRVAAAAAAAAGTMKEDVAAVVGGNAAGIVLPPASTKTAVSTAAARTAMAAALGYSETVFVEDSSSSSRSSSSSSRSSSSSSSSAEAGGAGAAAAATAAGGAGGGAGAASGTGEGSTVWKLAYYTPEGEVDLCGHATIACLGYMAHLGLIPRRCSKCHTTTTTHACTCGASTSNSVLQPVTIDTLAGKFVVRFEAAADGDVVVFMQQGAPTVEPMKEDVARLAKALGLPVSSIVTSRIPPTIARYS